MWAGCVAGRACGWRARVCLQELVRCWPAASQSQNCWREFREVLETLNSRPVNPSSFIYEFLHYPPASPPAKVINCGYFWKEGFGIMHV